MGAEARGELTDILNEVRAGSRDAQDRLIRAQSDWRFARAWLRGQLGGSAP
jgi:hypothetical protein